MAALEIKTARLLVSAYSVRDLAFEIAKSAIIKMSDIYMQDSRNVICHWFKPSEAHTPIGQWYHCWAFVEDKFPPSPLDDRHVAYRHRIYEEALALCAEDPSLVMRIEDDGEHITII